MEIDKITTTPEERKVLLAKLNAKLSQWQAECAADVKQSERMKAQHEAMGRHFDAHKLVHELYGSTHDRAELCAAVETILAELPTASLTDVELVKLRRRHESLALVKKIVELRGTPLDAATESQLQQKFERVVASVKAAAPWESNNNVKSKKK
jgi:hypothetical protein